MFSLQNQTQTHDKVWSLVSSKLCSVGRVGSKDVREGHQTWSNLEFGNCFLLSLGLCCNSWRVETKMFLLKLSRPTAVSLKPELRKAAACLLSLSPPPYNTPRGFYTTSLVVGVPVCIFFLCTAEMRPYLISGTLPRWLHTPVSQWFGVKGSTPVFSFYPPHGNLKSEVERQFPHRDQWSIVLSFPSGYLDYGSFQSNWEGQDHLLASGSAGKWYVQWNLIVLIVRSLRSQD